MNVIVPTLINPFSFFCISVENNETNPFCIDSKKISHDKINGSHGEYVAVYWNNKWTRGVISVESNFQVWLIDYGIYIRPDSKSDIVTLPSEYKKQPTRVFEASIHGVVPLQKIINDECVIENQMAADWNKGSIEKAQELVNNAIDLYFMPVAVLITKHNEVILGDLYLRTLESGVVNIIDELEKWPVFLQKQPDNYIQNLSAFYTSRKKHRACLEKPSLGNTIVPNFSVSDTIDFYQNILKGVPKIEFEDDSDNVSEIGSTVLGEKLRVKTFTLTPSEVVHYSDMTITINGREYNALQILLNKIKDLEMCEKYKDAKSVGRALTNRFLYRNLL